MCKNHRDRKQTVATKPCPSPCHVNGERRDLRLSTTRRVARNKTKQDSYSATLLRFPSVPTLCGPGRAFTPFHSHQIPHDLFPPRFDTRSHFRERKRLETKSYLDSSQRASYAAGSKSVSGTSSVILIFMNQPLPMGSSFRMPGVSVNA